MSIPHPGFRIPHSRQQRRAFTLIELLTVIIIIGILMAILVPAVMNARVKAIDSQMVAEIAQLDTAMKQFRTNYSVLPPAVHTPGNAAQVQAFWRRVWPRWASTSAVANLDPPEVLVFYLGGVSDKINTGASTKVTGFNLNPLSPISNGGQRSTPLFQFDQGRLLDEDGDNYYEYYPPQKRSVGDGVAPYFYFDFTSYSYNYYASPPQPASGASLLRHAISGAQRFLCNSPGGDSYGYALPYFDAAVIGKFMNADSFQIVGAGQDNHFGANANKTFPIGTNYIKEDEDNVTNFSTSRLEDAKP